MAFPILEVAGLASNVLGGILQSNEAKSRFRAMRKAAQRLARQKAANFNQAMFAIRDAQHSWETDPGRASLRSLWEQRLANPNVVSEGDLSNLKQTALSEAGSESAGAVNALREQAQRRGLGNSAISLGNESAIRSRAFGKAAGISTGLDLSAAKANRQAQDEVREGYGRFVSDEGDQRRGYAAMISNLLGNRQYDDTDLYAQLT